MEKSPSVGCEIARQATIALAAISVHIVARFWQRRKQIGDKSSKIQADA
jgi:hypothetical protein